MTETERGARAPPKGPSWTRGKDKPKDLGKAMRELLGYMGPDRRPVFIGMACTLLATMLALIGPQFLEAMTDAISGSISSGTSIDLRWISDRKSVV